MPVVAPVDESWENVGDAVNAAHRLSTALSNWVVHRMLAADDCLSAAQPEAIRIYSAYADAMTCLRCSLPWSEQQLPRVRRKATATRPAIDKPPRPQCRCGGEPAVRYPERSEWCGAMQSFQSVCRGVEGKYRSERFAAVYRCDNKKLTFRFPQPWPVHKDNWSLAFATGPWPGEAPVVTLALPALGRVALRLAAGPEWARQLGMLRQFICGTAKKGEAAVLRDRKGRLVVKLVGHFPRKDRGAPTNVAFVHTDPNAMLVVEINGHRTNVTNGDHIRRTIAKHRTFRQRVSEDKKREKRMDRRQLANLEKYVEDRCQKQNARLKTAVYQVAAQVKSLCERRGVGLVCYDDSNRTWVSSQGKDDLPFPWHALKTRLQQLLGSKPPGEEATGELGCGWIDGQFARLPTFEERGQWLQSTLAMLTAARRIRSHKSRPPLKSHPAVSAARGTSSAWAGASSTTCSAATSKPRRTPRGSAGSAT